MSLLMVVRIFTLTIFFNLFLPSGDVYSDVILMYQTWKFQNTDSLEMVGCRACYGKEEKDLLASRANCTTCITQRTPAIRCGGYMSFINKLLEIENDGHCVNNKFAVNYNGTLTEGKCENHHDCCFETKNHLTKMKRKDENELYSDSESNYDYSYGDYDHDYYDDHYDDQSLLGPRLGDLTTNKDENNIYSSDRRIGFGCGFDACRTHLGFVYREDWNIDGIHDFKSWKSRIGYDEYGGGGLIRLGGKNCRPLRIYSLSMAIPILINLIFSSAIFYNDLKSKNSTIYEALFLISLMYPQWRTLKILVRYFFHKDEEQLTNQLDENDKEVSFFEPFCESGLQVSTDNSLYGTIKPSINWISNKS